MEGRPIKCSKHTKRTSDLPVPGELRSIKSGMVSDRFDYLFSGRCDESRVIDLKVVTCIRINYELRVS